MRHINNNNTKKKEDREFYFQLMKNVLMVKLKKLKTKTKTNELRMPYEILSSLWTCITRIELMDHIFLLHKVIKLKIHHINLFDFQKKEPNWEREREKQDRIDINLVYFSRFDIKYQQINNWCAVQKKKNVEHTKKKHQSD